MASENKSPSYLAEREAVRRWLLNTREGQFAVQDLKATTKDKKMVEVLDDDAWTNWEDLYREHKESLVLAASCAEARAAAELAKQSSSIGAPPMSPGSKMLRFFSAPMGYVLRRQIETNDPDYWNDIKNVLNEAVNIRPEYATVPLSYLRAELENYLPKGKKIVSSTPGIITGD